MPRKKMTSAPRFSRATTIQEHLTTAATAFADEILRILSGSTLAELTTLTGHQPEEIAHVVVPQTKKAAPKPAKVEKAPRQSPAKAQAPVAEEKKKPTPRTSALRRMAGTKPVECPVPGCNNPGIRSKMNFCNDHAAQLPRAEKVKFRQAQRSSHLAAIKAGLVEPLAEPLPQKRGPKKKNA